MTGRERYRTRWAAWTVIAIAWSGACLAVIARGGAVEWFVLILLACVAIVSGWLPIAASKGITLERVVSDTEMEAGQSVSVTLRMKRMWRLPMVWVAVEESIRNISSFDAQTVPYKTVFAPMFGRTAVLSYSFEKLARGTHQFAAITVTCGDLFGLTAVRREFALETELIVLPSLPENERLSLAQSTGQRHAESSAHAVSSSTGGAGSDAFAGLPGRAGLGPDSRPYREGDSLRHLDFRAAARGRGLHTKLHDGNEVRTERFIWIDQFAEPYKKDSLLFDACVSWCLLDAQRSAEAGGTVALYADEWTCHLSGSSGKEYQRHMSELKHRLARLTPSAQQKEWAGLTEFDRDRIGYEQVLTVYSADWHNSGRWIKLAERAGEMGCSLELYLATRNAVPSFGMREMARLLGAGGIECYWLHVAQSKEAGTSSGKGEGAYALG